MAGMVVPKQIFERCLLGSVCPLVVFACDIQLKRNTKWHGNATSETREAACWRMEGRYTVCVPSRPAGGGLGSDGASGADVTLPLHMTEGLQHLRMMEGVSRSLPSSPLLSHQAVGVRPVRKLTGRGRRALHCSLCVQTGSIQKSANTGLSALLVATWYMWTFIFLN